MTALTLLAGVWLVCATLVVALCRAASAGDAAERTRRLTVERGAPTPRLTRLRAPVAPPLTLSRRSPFGTPEPVSPDQIAVGATPVFNAANPPPAAGPVSPWTIAWTAQEGTGVEAKTIVQVSSPI